MRTDDMNEHDDENEGSALPPGFHQRLGKDAYDRWTGYQARNLSVRVHQALVSRRRKRRVAQLTLAGLTTAAVVVMAIFLPSEQPLVDAVEFVRTEQQRTVDTEIANVVLDGMVDVAALDLLAEETYAEPVIITDADIDALLRDLQ